MVARGDVLDVCAAHYASSYTVLYWIKYGRMDRTRQEIRRESRGGRNGWAGWQMCRARLRQKACARDVLGALRQGEHVLEMCLCSKQSCARDVLGTLRQRACARNVSLLEAAMC